MYLPTQASPQQLRQAEQAQRNRQDIVKALSQGQVSRRDLFKWGLFTAGGGLAFQNGLNPFIGNAYGEIPTGVPRSPLFGAAAFECPMPRCDLMERKDISTLSPAPQKAANTAKTKVSRPDGIQVDGPMEGRPPGDIWAHQGWDLFPPKVAVEQWQKGAEPCLDYNPGVNSSYNCGIDPLKAVKPCFHTKMPAQSPQSLWTCIQAVSGCATRRWTTRVSWWRPWPAFLAGKMPCPRKAMPRRVRWTSAGRSSRLKAAVRPAPALAGASASGRTWARSPAGAARPGWPATLKIRTRCWPKAIRPPCCCPAATRMSACPIYALVMRMWQRSSAVSRSRTRLPEGYSGPPGMDMMRMPKPASR